MLLVSFGDYVLVGLEFLRSLPVASILDPINPGSSFAIHPGSGLTRVNGRFGEPPFSKTLHQFPSNVLEIATPSPRALPTHTSTAIFDPATFSLQTGTGVLVALNLLVVLWSLSLLALSLTYKPVSLAVRTWLVALHCCVMQSVRTVFHGIVCVVDSVAFDLKQICHRVLDRVAGLVSTLLCSIRDNLAIAQTLYSYFKFSIAFILDNQRALLSFGSFAPMINIIPLFLFCDIDIPYIDLLLLIAASPTIASSCVLLAILLGVIKPSCPNPSFIKIVYPADMVAGRRVNPPNRFLSDLVPMDHSGGTLVDIREVYRQRLRARRQALAANSRMTKFTIMWIAIALFGLGVNYMTIYPIWIAVHGAKVSSRAENILNVLNIIKSESFHSIATDATVASSPLSLIWTPVPRVCPLFARNSEPRSRSINDLDIFQMDSQFTLLPRLGCLAENSTRAGTLRVDGATGARFDSPL